jgi:hypothetical protein
MTIYPPFRSLFATAALGALVLSGCGQQSQQANAGSVGNGPVTPPGPTPDELARQQEEMARQQRVAAIERILRADQEAGRLGDSRRIAPTMRALDTTGAPDDFRSAYLVHVQAWEDAARVDTVLADLNSEETARNTIGLSILATLLDADAHPIRDLTEALAAARARRTTATEAIRSTFQEVERIAVAHGAQLQSAPSPAGNSM